MDFEPMVHLVCTGSKLNAMGIYIDKPCSEDWNKMTPTEIGAFCKKCALEVYDFSGKSPLEIKQVLLKNKSGSLCGRISPSTLETMNLDFRAWESNNKRSFQSILIFSLIIAFGFTLFSCNEEEKQTFGEIQTAGQSLIKEKHELPLITEDSLVVELNSAQKSIPKVIPNENRIEIDEIQIAPDFPQENIKGAMRYDPMEFEDVEQTDIMMLGGMGFSPSFIEHLQEDIEISESEAVIEFSSKISPNPAKQAAQLEIELPQVINAEVKLFNLAGELVKNLHSGLLENGKQKIDINLDGLIDGIYLVTIQSEEYSTSIKLRKF